MPAALEYLGREAKSSRDMYVIDAAGPDDIPAEVNVAGPLFVCFLAWDAEHATIETIDVVARRLLAAGCVYICCWGSRCSLVHDVFDSVSIERGSEAPVIMSTWHERESLSDAIWFALFAANPDDSFSEHCGSVLAVSVGRPSYAKELREALADPGTFSQEVIERG